METDWTGYNCKSGEILFVYNKVTGQHKWPAGLENVSSLDNLQRTFMQNVIKHVE